MKIIITFKQICKYTQIVPPFPEIADMLLISHWSKTRISLRKEADFSLTGQKQAVIKKSRVDKNFSSSLLLSKHTLPTVLIEIKSLGEETPL